MRRKVKGIVKNSGYHQTWDTGRASFAKRMQKLGGINKVAE